jgi:hypothetical protein
VIVSANERIHEQLAVTGITDVIGTADVYAGDERIGAAVHLAYDDRSGVGLVDGGCG